MGFLERVDDHKVSNKLNTVKVRETEYKRATK